MVESPRPIRRPNKLTITAFRQKVSGQAVEGRNDMDARTAYAVFIQRTSMNGSDTRLVHISNKRNSFASLL